MIPASTAKQIMSRVFIFSRVSRSLVSRSSPRMPTSPGSAGKSRSRWMAHWMFSTSCFMFSSWVSFGRIVHIRPLTFVFLEERGLLPPAQTPDPLHLLREARLPTELVGVWSRWHR